MEPLTAITSVLSSLKIAADIVKLLKDSDLSLEKAELKLKLAELMGALADVKMQMADIKDLVGEKDEVIRELQEKRDIKSKLKWEPPYYWLIEDDTKEGPFCQACWDDKDKLVRLQARGSHWDCKSCKNTYRDSSYRPPSQQRAKPSF